MFPPDGCTSRSASTHARPSTRTRKARSNALVNLLDQRLLFHQAFNGLDGVDDSCTGNEISRNSIFSNGGLGIDLRGAGEGFSTDVANPNDPGDADFAANNLQNNPVIISAKTVLGTTTAEGTLDGIPGEAYTIEFSAPRTVASS